MKLIIKYVSRKVQIIIFNIRKKKESLINTIKKTKVKIKVHILKKLIIVENKSKIHKE